MTELKKGALRPRLTNIAFAAAALASCGSTALAANNNDRSEPVVQTAMVAPQALMLADAPAKLDPDAVRNLEAYASRWNASPEVLQTIETVAAKTGTPASFMFRKVARESGFHPDIKAPTTSATGLYQFIDSTWLEMMSKYGDAHGYAREAAQIEWSEDGRPFVRDPETRRAILDLRKNSELASEMAVHLDHDNAVTLESMLGRKVSYADLYLADFLGSQGAIIFTNEMQANPSRSAASVMPSAAATNPKVFYDAFGRARTLHEIYQQMQQEFDNGALPDFSGEAYVSGKAYVRPSWHMYRHSYAQHGSAPLVSDGVYHYHWPVVPPPPPVPQVTLDDEGNVISPVAKTSYVADTPIYRPMSSEQESAPPALSSETMPQSMSLLAEDALLGASILGLGLFVGFLPNRRRRFVNGQPVIPARAKRENWFMLEQEVDPVTGQPVAMVSNGSAVARGTSSVGVSLSSREAAVFDRIFANQSPRILEDGSRRVDYDDHSYVAVQHNSLTISEKKGIEQAILYAAEAWDGNNCHISCTDEALSLEYAKALYNLKASGKLAADFTITGLVSYLPPASPRRPAGSIPKGWNPFGLRGQELAMA